MFTDEPFLCLDESSRVACNSGETQTRKLLLLFGCDRLLQNPDTSGPEWGNFKALKCCYIKIYQADLLLCYVKAIDLQHI